jgi:hypothetical protein
MGIHNPVAGSEVVSEYISKGWEERVGGKLEFITDADEILERTLAHIDAKREALGLPEYDASKWGKSGDGRMQALLELPLEERIAAVYGARLEPGAPRAGVPEAAD